MADTPREFDRVNSILRTDDVLANGPRTPWSPIRGLTGRRPGPIAATRLLDLEDEGFERPAVYSGRGGATTGAQLRGQSQRTTYTSVEDGIDDGEALWSEHRPSAITRRLSGYQSSSARREGRRRTLHIEEQGAVSVGALVDNGGANRQRARGRDDRSQSRCDEGADRHRLTARSTGRWAGSSEAEAGRSTLVLDDDRRRSSQQGDDGRGCRGDHGDDVNERRGQRRDQRWLSDRSDPDRWGPGDDANDECDHATAGVGARLRSAVAVPAPATVSKKERDGGVRRSRRRSTTRSGSRRRRSERCRSRRRASSSSDDGGGGNRRHRIRLGTFDGVRPFETFWAHFENCAAYNRWSEADRLAHLKASLTGDAGQVLWDSDAAATDTLAKLTALLRGRYGNSRQVSDGATTSATACW